jgi:hypothetical protein
MHACQSSEGSGVTNTVRRQFSNEKEDYLQYHSTTVLTVCSYHLAVATSSMDLLLGLGRRAQKLPNSRQARAISSTGPGPLL